MKKSVDLNEVPAEKLSWKCDPDSLGFETTEECEYIRGIIGQERAVRSIRMGLEIDSPGYNIYASGLTGTGKTSTIRTLLNQLDPQKKIPDDICYVNNFSNPDMPRVMMLPAGMGRKFKKDIHELVLHLKKDIPLIFESEDFKKASEQIANNYRTKQKELIREFNDNLAKENLQLVQFQIGPYTKQDIAPLYEGKPILLKQLEELAEQGKLDKKELKKIKEKLDDSRIELDSLMRETRQIEKEIRKETGSLEYKYGLPVVSGIVSDIRIKYKNNNEKINDYLEEVQEHILSNLKQFKEKDEEQQQAISVPLSSLQKENLTEYEVNVLVDNSQTNRPPIVMETAPTYKNLFGTIEREIDRSGFWRTNFTRIKAGSLLRANGGYIVFNALEALIEPGVWTFLKRTLKNRLLIMQPYDPFSIASTALKPESIPLDVKVIMVGDDYLYHLLYKLEEDFKKIFKTKAHFDTEMPKTEENIACYINFLKMIIKEENLLQFDKKAAAAVIEFGVKLTSKQKKLSTRFSDVADLVREASYWAKSDGNNIVTDKYVNIAYTEKIERVSLIENKTQEMIEDGTIMIDTYGEKVGQVNGLSVYDMGDYAFGKPSKITAETSMGKAGIINIEREAKLSGKTYDKGILILEGYFRRKYAQDKPLTMIASICFEQSYGGVDGDSASSTEIYAILSSLSNLPIRQDIAVTGSVNQKGEIQPIGGVNQKIEGFYDVCKAKGLSETQGVMIPALNTPDLMLRKDVIESVSEGKFYIYPVSTINEGITILTGVEAGEMDEDGKYPENTVNLFVDERLRTLATNLKDFDKEEEREDNTK